VQRGQNQWGTKGCAESRFIECSWLSLIDQRPLWEARAFCGCNNELDPALAMNGQGV